MRAVREASVEGDEVGVDGLQVFSTVVKSESRKRTALPWLTVCVFSGTR